MSADAPIDVTAHHECRFLAALGVTVRLEREQRGLSRRALAALAQVSERYLAQLESGRGNISVLLLKRIADALSVDIASLVVHGAHAQSARELLRVLERTSPTQQLAAVEAARHALNRAPHPWRGIALVGLRGAGKSTLGRLAAAELGLPFCELNDRISEASGLSIADIFNLYGVEGYRRWERRCLESLLERESPLLLATGGGIVSDERTFEQLFAHFFTVWIRATPAEHMERVRAQGDTRPMTGSEDAMDELRALLRSREPLYARADAQLDTTGRSVENCTLALVQILRDSGFASA